MCGIVGYVGNKEVLPILVEGLERLEYRGYDSAGVAFINPGEMICVKSVGKIETLRRRLEGCRSSSTIGIGHTRWATHGLPSVENAHPHVDCKHKIALVHNGIIENYDYLKSMLKKEGHRFASDTDTEVLVHLIEKYFRGDLADAMARALQEVEGTYGLAAISQDDPDKVVAARFGSPLAVGLGKGEQFVTSDVAAILNHTRKVVYLEDRELAVLTREKVDTRSVGTAGDTCYVDVHIRAEEVEWEVGKIEKKGYRHFMHKEIHEQHDSLLNLMRGRVSRDSARVRLGVFFEKQKALEGMKHIVIVACGTSWHAGLVGEYMLEELGRIPAEVEYASEFRYRKPVIEEGTVVIAISQSGETADTLAALREAKKRGAMTLAICNVVGSSIAREAEGGIYLHAGPEIGVASTKAFTSQMATLYLLALFVGLERQSGLSEEEAVVMINALRKIPDQVETIMQREKQIEDLAELYKDSENFLYLGRGYNFPVALEGALKLKEISYIHAEGYPAAEMKHGPIALITRDMPVVFIAIKDSTYAKILGNIEEVKARGGKVIAIATEGDDDIREKVDHVFYIPKTVEPLTPILSVIPLQLLAYHMAVLRGCDVDKPRNLAKSVTVE
ncbi:MAG: glutamine--fructose-6-phosphate transaminase (isomerizing) [Candidatus Brocadiales bacterium]